MCVNVCVCGGVISREVKLGCRGHSRFLPASISYHIAHFTVFHVFCCFVAYLSWLFHSHTSKSSPSFNRWRTQKLWIVEKLKCLFIAHESRSRAHQIGIPSCVPYICCLCCICCFPSDSASFHREEKKIERKAQTVVKMPWYLHASPRSKGG